MSNLHKRSWFAVKGVPGCVEISSGSLAGNSLGNYVFLLAFSRVLNTVEKALADAGLLYQMSPEYLNSSFSGFCQGQGEDQQIKLGPGGYVDDFFQPIIAPARDIVEKMRQCACLYQEVFSRFGLTINFKRGKTEALFRFAGPGAIIERRKLFRDHSSAISFENLGFVFLLAATATYKHVGTLKCCTDTLQPEITAKLDAMNATFEYLKPAFLNRPAVSIEKRLLLARSVLLAKGFISSQNMASLIFRGNIPRTSCDNSANESLIAPAIMILFLRVSLFVCVCACALLIF